MRIQRHILTAACLQPPNFSLTVGSSEACDVTIKQDSIEATHAEILHRPHGRMYCRCLAGDAESLSSKTAVWLEETELRSGVDYMLSPGAKLSFGTQGQNVVRVEFHEGVEGGMAEMMMNVMAQGVCFPLS
jgi:FHA domain